MGVLLGEEVAHGFDGGLVPRGRLGAINHQEVTLLRPTSQVAVEVEEVVVARRTSQEELLGKPHVGLQGAQLVDVTTSLGLVT